MVELHKFFVFIPVKSKHALTRQLIWSGAKWKGKGLVVVLQAGIKVIEREVYCYVKFCKTKRSNLMTWVNPDLGESGKELEVVQMPMEYILQQVALPGSGE
ncbi:hypothetical protein RHGRI_030899 [Rhododendron griersonianum]|uniref:Uncharacterized protein n=1 Tax=Rhododendron griersonianum TaxID=479676 RepID=A0AAV6I6C2_9ERIC|nr:hypothetical protein RHGRI_030899 [Rhododendron griersonianum]